MSDLAPGTLIRMRTTKRFGHYNVDELIAVTPEQGRELYAKRLAQPVDMLVPSMRSPEPPDAATGGATRTPAHLVRK